MTQVDERETASLTACVAHVLGVNASEVPGDGGVGLRQWLARRNLGLVPVESPVGFAWPGRFLGRRSESRTWAVMFGVPPGVVFEPEPVAAPDTLDAAFVLSPHDPQRETDAGRSPRPSEVGVVELVAVAVEAEGQMRTVPSAEALAGRGLRGATATPAEPVPSRTRAVAATTSRWWRSRSWRNWRPGAWTSPPRTRGATSSSGA